MSPEFLKATIERAASNEVGAVPPADCNSGNYNSGNRNSGGHNSGDCNSGNRNSGYYNSGNYNSGYYNSGYCNFGNYNSGDCNSGNCNSGGRNSGNRNSGGWNSGDRETGFFNTASPKMIKVFNKPCPVNLWEEAEKPAFIYFTINQWVCLADMTEAERAAFPLAETVGGFVKCVPYKEAFIASYEGLTTAEKERQTALLKALPNFDPNVFFEISGIMIP